jgi:hypothetical protein
VTLSGACRLAWQGKGAGWLRSGAARTGLGAARGRGAVRRGEEEQGAARLFPIGEKVDDGPDKRGNLVGESEGSAAAELGRLVVWAGRVRERLARWAGRAAGLRLRPGLRGRLG